MGRNRGKRTKRKPSPPAKSTIQLVSTTPSSPVPSPPKPRFHIDWKQVNFLQFLVIFALFLFLLLYIVIPVLNEINWIRPHAYAIAQIIGSSFVVIATILSAGVINVQKVNLWQKPKLKQAFYALAISSLATLIVLLTIVQPPPLVPTHPQLASIPYPPYHGTLVLNGMQSRPSKGYYWEQKTNSDGSCKFVGADYHVATSNQKGLEICPAINTSFHNFAFEIDMTFLKPGNAAILFEATNQTAYQLTITSLGNYAQVSLAVLSGLDSQEPNVRGLIDPILIVARDQGPVQFASGYTNRIAVVVNNQTIVPYVNGLTVPTLKRSDDSSNQGGIALEAFNSSDSQNTQTEVVFSNARVWAL